MNQRFGFTLGYDDYTAYDDSLAHNPLATLCNTILQPPPLQHTAK